LRLFGGVVRDESGLAAANTNLLRDLLSALNLNLAQDNVRSRFRQCASHLCADPACSSRDGHYFATPVDHVVSIAPIRSVVLPLRYPGVACFGSNRFRSRVGSNDLRLPIQGSSNFSIDFTG
jgi:hypothetical protein